MTQTCIGGLSMSTLPCATAGVNLEAIPPKLLSRLGFRLPKPITPPPADKSPGNWPTWKECSKAPKVDSLAHAIQCAKKLLRAYPAGEAPEALEARLERLLNRAYRERRKTKRGKMGAERPALPDMRQGRMKPLPVDEMAAYRYRIVQVALHYVQRTETDFAFLDDMRYWLDFFERRGN